MQDTHHISQKQITVELQPTNETPWTAQSIRLIAVPVSAVALDKPASQWLSRLGHQALLPVVDQHKKLQGVLRQDLLQFAPVVHEQAEFLMIPLPAVLKAEQDIKAALPLFEQFNLPLIPIVDNKGRYTGECASYTQWFRLQHGLLRPSRIGGFATPFGVYLTSGIYRSGPDWKEIIATGLLFGLVVYGLDWFALLGFSILAAIWPTLNLLNTWQEILIHTGFTIIGLFALMRFTPLSGLHAAEHMTVSAIEQDLVLDSANVRTQSREHRRCGTNLMVLLGSVQMLIFSIVAFLGQMNPAGLLLYSLIWMGLTLRFWRTIGLWVQRNFTTKPPTDAQLHNGIQAGQDLLEKFMKNPHPTPTVWQRLWNSGLFPLMGSSLLTIWVLEQLFR